MKLARLSLWFTGYGLKFRYRSLVVAWLPLSAALIFVGCLWSMQSKTQAFDLQGRERIAVLASVQDLVQDLTERHDELLYTYMLNRKAFAHRAISDRSIDAQERLAALDRVASNARERAQLSSIIPAGAKVWNFQAKLAHLRPNDTATINAGLVADDLAIRALIRQVGVFRKSEVDWTRADNKKLSEFWSMLQGALIAGVFGLIAVILGTVALFKYGLVGRLRKLAETARLIAKGSELGASLGGSDEIADLDRHLRRMASDVREREQEFARYELLCRYMSDSVLFIDPVDGTILDHNQAAADLYGYSSDELRYHRVWDLRLPEDKGLLGELGLALKDSAAETNGISYEATALRKDGSTFPFEGFLRVAALGREKIIISVVRDVSESRRLDEMRRDRDKAVADSKFKSEFVAMMSHEIRTPMNGIIAMTELLLRGKLDSGQRDCATVVSDSAQALLRIVNDILDLSKIEARKLEFETVPFDPRATLLSVISSLALDAKKGGIALVSEISPDLPSSILGDPTRIKQILWNLVGNAVKFTERGSVSIKACAEQVTDGEVSLSFEVRDTGIGISPTAQAALFQPFAQADMSMSRRFGGTGLGLSVAHRLVTLMRGSIDVSSEQGVGTTVTVVLPFQTGNPQKSGSTDELALPADSATFAATASYRILVVEDNEINRRVVERQFSVLGYECMMAEHGRAALQLVRNQTFDMIFMDCNMPEMDGYEATRAIRELERDSGRHTPIIAFTANAMAQERQRCAEVGMDDYVSKPLMLAALRGVLESWLAPHKESAA